MEEALRALGKGFDFTSDFRVRFARGSNGDVGRLVVVDEVNKRDIVTPGFTIKGVSEDIRIDKGDRIRFKSDVLEFNQVHMISFYAILI